MSTAEARCEVAVVGAGAVGLTAAIAFAKAGFETRLVGRLASRRDGRTVALLGDSVELLQQLRAWPRLEAQAPPLRVMQIVEAGGRIFAPPPARFAAAEIGAPAFGYNVETGDLLAGLAGAAGAQRNLSWAQEGVASIEWRERPALLLEDGSALEAGVVVGADGRDSVVRRAAGIGSESWSYPQTALTTILAHEADHDDTSTEFHTPFGPFTLVPMPGRRSSLVWVTHPRHAERLAALDDGAFAAAIERQAGSMLGAMRIEGPRGRFPIRGLSVERLDGPGIVLIGEAAHVLPPIGAQGLNLGLRDVSVLRDILVKARAAGETIGSEEVLARYGRARAGDVRLRSGAVDMLNRSILSDFLPGHILRWIGLVAVGSIGPLRRALMRQGLAARQDGATVPFRRR